MKKKLGLLALGACAGYGLLLGAAYIFGPRSERSYIDLATGAKWTDHRLLWHRWRATHPVAEHTEWARSNTGAVRPSRPVLGSSFDRFGWFGGTRHATGIGRDFIRSIYKLPVPHERKVELLHEFQEDVGNLAPGRGNATYRALYKKWDEKLKEEPQPADGAPASP